MAWLRLWRRPAAVVALLALLLQLALSFGHVHLAHADQPGPVAAASDADDDSEIPQPQHPSDDHDSHYCAIYAMLALLTGSKIAVAPVVAAPAAHAIAVAPIVAVAVQLVQRHDAFRSRAPPLS